MMARWVRLVTPLVLIALVGCEPAMVDDPEALEAKTPYDSDLPVPRRFEPVVGSSYRRVPGSYREAKLIYAGRATAEAVVQFAIDRMIQAGWRETFMNSRPLRSEIRFVKPGGLSTPPERCTVIVAPQGDRTRLELHVERAPDIDKALPGPSGNSVQ
jgi:hypothetical protein